MQRGHWWWQFYNGGCSASQHPIFPSCLPLVWRYPYLPLQESGLVLKPQNVQGVLFQTELNTCWACPDSLFLLLYFFPV